MIYDLADKNKAWIAHEHLDKMMFEHKIIELKEYKPKRSNLQNRYYWAILNFIADETGNDKDTLHEVFKVKFLNPERFMIFDQNLTIWPSTAKLNKTEFNDYIEKIRIFASTELELTIPSPMDKDFDQFIKHYEKMIV